MSFRESTSSRSTPRAANSASTLAIVRGGKPIIALPSTAAHGSVSRIVPELKPGAGVVTPRGHVSGNDAFLAYRCGESIPESDPVADLPTPELPKALIGSRG